MEITGWQPGEVVMLKSQCGRGKSVFKESEDTSTKGTRERGVDRHEEKVIKPGFRQAFMGSQTQTSFEALKRFWAYNSDNSDWRKKDIWLKLCTQTWWDTRNQGNKIASKMDYGKKRMKEKRDGLQRTGRMFCNFRIWIMQTLFESLRWKPHTTDFGFIVINISCL